MSKNKILTLVFISLFLIVACVTVNIYFPAAEVQKAADKIVGDVRGEGLDDVPAEETPEVNEKKETLLDKHRMNISIGVKSAYAQMDINVTTPAIRSLMESLKNRFPDLKSFYKAGAIGETNKGMVETRDLKGLGLKEKSLLLRMVGEENKDREDLYKEILKANNLGPEHFEEVQKIFAKSWQEKAPEGWWIQKEDGTWIKKQ